MSEEWHYTIGGKQAGPVPSAELKQLASTGRLSQTDMVRKEGMPDWVPAGKLKGLFVARNPYTPPAIPLTSQLDDSITYAGFWKRFAAVFIDGIITGVGGLVIGFVFGIVMVAGGTEDPEVLEFLGNIIGTIIGWLYFSVMESSFTQATLGKMALGIKVTDLDGNKVGFGRATGRHFSKILSGLILLIGFVMVAFTEKKQGLHDVMAGCLVVNK